MTFSLDSKRHGVRLLTMNGETLSANKEHIEEFVKRIRTLLQDE